MPHHTPRTAPIMRLGHTTLPTDEAKLMHHSGRVAWLLSAWEGKHGEHAYGFEVTDSLGVGWHSLLPTERHAAIALAARFSSMVRHFLSVGGLWPHSPEPYPVAVVRCRQDQVRDPYSVPDAWLARCPMDEWNAAMEAERCTHVDWGKSQASAELLLMRWNNEFHPICYPGRKVMSMDGSGTYFVAGTNFLLRPDCYGQIAHEAIVVAQQIGAGAVYFANKSHDKEFWDDGTGPHQFGEARHPRSDGRFYPMGPPPEFAPWCTYAYDDPDALPTVNSGAYTQSIAAMIADTHDAGLVCVLGDTDHGTGYEDPHDHPIPGCWERLPAELVDTPKTRRAGAIRMPSQP